VLLTAAEKPEQAANGCWPLLFLRKGAFGDTIVVTVFTFIAIPTAGFASLGHEFAVLGAIKLDFLVLFHFISSCLSATITAVGSCYGVRPAPSGVIEML
jgi:hypothetical protein